jgi:hypothetical protein
LNAPVPSPVSAAEHRVPRRLPAQRVCARLHPRDKLPVTYGIIDLTNGTSSQWQHKPPLAFVKPMAASLQVGIYLAGDKTPYLVNFTRTAMIYPGNIFLIGFSEFIRYCRA